VGVLCNFGRVCDSVCDDGSQVAFAAMRRVVVYIGS